MPFFKKCFLLLFLSCLLAGGSSAQNSREELQKREQELQKELTELNRLYSETQNNKKLSLRQLAIIKSKINRREELVNSINKQIRQLDETIYLKERDIYRLRRELDTLKLKYAKSINFAFKHRSNLRVPEFLILCRKFQ
jgi:lipopolysaccharide export LptBFGC system permease protein LptF